MDEKLGKIRTGSQTSVQLHSLPVQAAGGQGETHPSALADFNIQDTGIALQTSLFSPEIDLIGLQIATQKEVLLGWFHMGLIQWHLKNS